MTGLCQILITIFCSYFPLMKKTASPVNTVRQLYYHLFLFFLKRNVLNGNRAWENMRVRINNMVEINNRDLQSYIHGNMILEQIKAANQRLLQSDQSCDLVSLLMSRQSRTCQYLTLALILHYYQQKMLNMFW